MRSLTMAAIAAMCIPCLSAQANEAPAVHVAQLTLGSATRMARGAIAACRKAGYQVAVTVVDRDGITQVALRDTLAPPVALRISRDKAYTSAMFDAKGTALEQTRARSPLAQAGEHLVFSGGAVPIEAGGVFYGAIGVSGTPEGRIDERCAEAGLAVLKGDLEMQP
ncbi:MAG: heme-binding protein [Betaproteobacteria bacterium]|nr:heme-binding protein [Betaproteobacteria bacterium]